MNEKLERFIFLTMRFHILSTEEVGEWEVLKKYLEAKCRELGFLEKYGCLKEVAIEDHNFWECIKVNGHEIDYKDKDVCLQLTQDYPSDLITYKSIRD